MPALSELSKWIDANKNADSLRNDSIVELLESLGFKDVLWLKMLVKNCSVEAKSKELKVDTSSCDGEEILQVVNDYLKNENSSKTLTVFSKDYHVLYVQKNTKGVPRGLIMAQKINTEELTSINFVCNIAIDFIQRKNELEMIENSTKALYLDLHQISNPAFYENVELPQKFIDDAVPVMVYSLVNETMGPVFIRAHPESFDDHTNLLFVVNLFSSQDSEMLGRIGHVYSSLTTTTPENAEATNIVFTVANEEARGLFELHAISIFIGPEFVNLSKSIYLNLKATLFSAAEEIRQQSADEGWQLISQDPDELPPNILEFIETMMFSVKKQVATFLAVNFSEQDLLNWGK